MWTPGPITAQAPNIRSMWRLCSLLLALLPNEGFVDVGNDTWEGKTIEIRKNTFIGKLNTEAKTRYSSVCETVNSPPPAIVALIRESNSSSPRMASCKWRGVIRFTFKSLEALPANSSTCEQKKNPQKINSHTHWFRPHYLRQTLHNMTSSSTVHYKHDHKQTLTSAVRYSRIAALYTAAVAPTRPWLVVRVFKCLWIRPTGNCQENTKKQSTE